MSGRDVQDILERGEERRRAVVAAAVELEALGCGDPFVDPIEPPETPEHTSKRLRIEELVDEIMVRTSVNVRVERLAPSYRFSWTHYPHDTLGTQVVVSTPVGPVAVASGVYTTDLEGEAKVPRSALEAEANDQEDRNRALREKLDELHEQKGSEPELRQEVHEELRNLVRCPDCDALLYRVGSFGDGGPFLLVMCSDCPWRGALYEDGGKAREERIRSLEREGYEQLKNRIDRLERVSDGWKMLALYRDDLIEAARSLISDLEDRLERMDEEARDG